MLAQNRVSVDGIVAKDIGLIINKFSLIHVDDVVLQEKLARYIMLNKPIGVVSATSDEQHKTVLDLIDITNKQDLHIVGRLDLNTTGLLLLTDDSRWSKQVTSPESKVAKCYTVTLKYPLTTQYISAFEKGMYFEFEDITTRPAILEIVSEHVARVTLFEGRYHQIKRMFGRFRNPVLKLHRSAIGNLILDERLAEGENRGLTDNEVKNIITWTPRPSLNQFFYDEGY